MLVDRVDVHPDRLDPADRTAWPFTVPAVGRLTETGLTFESPVTFLVGENGSGKSTIVEAIADACKINSQGGKAGTKYASAGEHTRLGTALEAGLTVAGSRFIRGPRRARKGFFLRAETLFNLGQHVSGRLGFWDADLDEQSHGEGFFTVLETMFREPGLYLMDEPEAALSFLSCLRLVELLHELGESGAQIICATHSPVLAATPGADIIQLDADGYHREEWGSLDVVDHWRRFLARPDVYLNHLDDGEK